MFKHLLIATDGSPASQQGAVKAVELAKSLSARVTAITVSNPFPVFATDAAVVEDTSSLYYKECEQKAERTLAAVEKAAAAAGVQYAGRHATDERPYVAIIDAAKTAGCDAICMASHGHRGMTGMMLGSETVKVLSHAAMPVVVWRNAGS